jgi:succinate-semialdehyde dehydrogenase / glutarate-semialdehyde dehydrogenase
LCKIAVTEIEPVLASINPTTGKTIETFEPLSPTQITEKLAKAAGAFAQYRRTSFAERRRWMIAAADLLEHESEKFARIITTEMGKLLRGSVEEVLKCARGCRYYAENAERFLADLTVKTDRPCAFVRHDPIGAILAIMPWNFPFWQVFRFAAPTLMAGNVALLKHAANVPQCAIAIEEIFCRAGFPEDVFQTLLVETDQVASIIDDARVKAVTLTGSERAGSEVASAAARQIKKSVLELGGSDPFVVMPSADIDAAIDAGVAARTINSGQSCIAAKRFIIAEQVYQRFMTGFLDRMRKLRIGDPFDPATDIGPLATESILLGLDRQVKDSIAAGARLHLGGNRIDASGFFYEPTVLSEIPRNAPAFSQEIFGPVASVFSASTPAEAVAIANDNPFGLGASVWTNDLTEQRWFASELEAGMIFINAIVVSDPCLPFGGVKRSGFGRELGAEGIREFVNIKTVSIA